MRVSVEVDVDDLDLEDEGWHHESNCDTNEHLVVAIRQAHNDEHAGPIRWCPHQLHPGGSA